MAEAPHIILPEIPEEKPFGERLQSLLSLDCVRISRILETAQYAALYAIICMPVGLGIDAFFSPFYPSTDNGEITPAQAWHSVLIAVLQVMVSAISILYIRKIADLFPFFLNLCPSRYVAHYHVDEVFGEAAIALVFVGMQTHLIKALEKIRDFFGPKGRKEA